MKMADKIVRVRRYKPKGKPKIAAKTKTRRLVAKPRTGKAVICKGK